MFRIICWVAIFSILYSCKSQSNQNGYSPAEFIGDLREGIKVHGQPVDGKILVILNIKSRQIVFDFTESNSTALSDVPVKYIDHMSIVVNNYGKYGTDYRVIYTLKLKKKAFELLDEELQAKLD